MKIKFGHRSPGDALGPRAGDCIRGWLYGRNAAAGNSARDSSGRRSPAAKPAGDMKPATPPATPAKPEEKP